MKRLPLIFSLLAVIVLSASIAYWAMELYKPKQRPLAPIVSATVAEPSADAAMTLFGGQASAVVASNYQLTGVVAAGSEGVAIIVADGQPPKAVKVGTELASGVLLQEVHPKYVMLSEGGVAKRIDLATDDKAGSNAALAAPGFGQAQQDMPAPNQPMQNQPMPMPVPNQPPQPNQPMPVPEQPGASVPVPPPQPNQPVEDPMALPPGVPPPPPPVQMPAPTRNMSSGGSQPPTQ